LQLTFKTQNTGYYKVVFQMSAFKKIRHLNLFYFLLLILAVAFEIYVVWMLFRFVGMSSSKYLWVYEDLNDL
jgi:hypothetical protein